MVWTTRRVETTCSRRQRFKQRDRLSIGIVQVY